MILFLCPLEGDVSTAHDQIMYIRACVVENFSSDPEVQAPLLYVLVGAHRHASRVYISAMIAVESSLAPQYAVVSQGWDSFPNEGQAGAAAQTLRFTSTEFSLARTVSRTGTGREAWGPGCYGYFFYWSS